jgi:hypothetical protein
LIDFAYWRAEGVRAAIEARDSAAW